MRRNFLTALLRGRMRLTNDGREGPVITWDERDFNHSRLDRYAWAARHLDDLPNRPQGQPGTKPLSHLSVLPVVAAR